MRSRVTTSLLSQGLSTGRADRLAQRISQAQGTTSAGAIPHYIRLDFAYATRTVLYVMAAVMAVAAVIALFGLRAGRQELVPDGERDPDATAVPIPVPGSERGR